MIRERANERTRERAHNPARSSTVLRVALSLSRSLALSLACVSAAFGQTSISGKVIDPQNKPVAQLEVLLHAVTGKTGQQVDRDTTNAEGRFTLRADNTSADAIYFVAVTWNGHLYVGDMMRPPFPANQEYIVQVGVNPIEAGPTTAEPASTAPPAESDRTAGTVVVIVAALAIAALLYFALRKRPPARRRWLVELARLEDEIAAGGDAEALQERRAELRGRLRAPQGS